MDHSRLMHKLYVDLIHSLALENPFLPDIVDELTLGSLMTEISHVDVSFSTSETATRESDSDSLERRPNWPAICGVIRDTDLLMFGQPARHHLDFSTRACMLQEIRSTLQSIAEFFYADQELNINEESNVLAKLPDMMQAFKADIEYKKEEVTLSSQFVAELMDQINETRKTFDSELQKAVSVTFPAFDATRTSSIDLLAAIIETALTKISLTRARAERALYNHQPRDTGAFDQDVNVAKTIEAAYFSLKKEEKEMRAQSQSLDRQLREYESLMQLVDGGRNGYQQIINDWAKVQQETDECLKDLRRLGWTGD